MNGVRNIWILALLMIGVMALNAQWDVTMEMNQSYSSNPLHIRDGVSSWVSAFSMGIGYESTDLYIQYYGNYNQFMNIAERNFYWHQFSLSGGSEHTVWGVSLNQQINRAEYNLYDYLNGSLWFQHVVQGTNQQIQWNARLSTTRYQQVSELDHWLFHTGIRFYHGFKTRTSVLGGVYYQYKQYLSGQTYTVSADSFPMLPDGRGRGGSWRTYWYGSRTISAAAPSASQIRYWVRLAQSLGRKTGLAVQFSQQFSLTSDDRYLAGLPANYVTDSQIFDDPMGYDAYSVYALMTHVFSPRMKLRIGYQFLNKDYNAQGIYRDAETFDESTLRQDDNQTAWLYFERQLLYRNRSGLGLQVYMQYQWQENQSNSYWYQYTDQSFLVGMTLSF